MRKSRADAINISPGRGEIASSSLTSAQTRNSKMFGSSSTVMEGSTIDTGTTPPEQSGYCPRLCTLILLARINKLNAVTLVFERVREAEVLPSAVLALILICRERSKRDVTYSAKACQPEKCLFSIL